MQNKEKEAWEEVWAEVVIKGKLSIVWWNGLRDRPVGITILIDEKPKYILRAANSELELQAYPEGDLV